MSYRKPKGSSIPPSAAPKAVEEKPTLSKSVLAMKFMQKKDTVEETADAPSSSQQSHSIPARATSDGSKTVWVRESSSVVFPGRRSFGGCNRFIERHYAKELEDKYNLKLSERETKNTISDEDMVKRYNELVSLPRGPNQGMRKTHSSPDKAGGNRSQKKKRSREEEDNVPLTKITPSDETNSKKFKVDKRK